MATLTAPQNKAWIDKTGSLNGAPILSDTPQIVTDRKLIQKVKYVALANDIATRGMREQSWFMQRFGNRFQTISGFKPEFFNGLRKDQEVVITMPAEKTGKFVADECDDVSYTGKSYEVLALKGGKVWDYTNKDCPPCPGDSCGEDAYDLDAVLNETTSANKAFAKAFDFMMFTGKDIANGSAVANYGGIFAGIQTSTSLGENYVSDIELTLAKIKDDIGNLAWQSFNNANAGLNYLKARNFNNDLVIFATAGAIAKIRQHYNTQSGSNFQTLAQPSVIGNIANMTLTEVGLWDSTFSVVEVPSALMPANTEIAIGDFGRFFGQVLCANEKWSDGGHENPFTNYYVKRFVFTLNDLSAEFGNYSYKIPFRDKQSYDVAMNTISSTGTSAQNPTFTKAVTV